MALAIGECLYNGILFSNKREELIQATIEVNFESNKSEQKRLHIVDSIYIKCPE